MFSATMRGMRPNWFIALPFSAEGWSDAVPGVPSGLRRFAPCDLHLTVAFLGGVSESVALAAWRGVSFDLESLEVTMGAVVPMGPPSRYSALSLLLADGREAVEAAMTRARAVAWQLAGALPDARPAKAHVTIARPRRKATDDERTQGLRWAEAIELPAASVRIDAIALYTWNDDRSHTLFRIVEQSALPKRSL